MQRDERGLQRGGFLRVQAYPFMHEVGVEAVAQGDVGDGGAGLGALLNDLGFKGFAVGTALKVHGESA